MINSSLFRLKAAAAHYYGAVKSQAVELTVQTALLSIWHVVLLSTRQPPYLSLLNILERTK